MKSGTCSLLATVILIFLPVGQLPAAKEGAVDPFYLKLLDEGTYSYRNGNLRDAAECLRVAAFGVPDDRARLIVCHTYLAIIYDRLKNPEMAGRSVRLLATLRASDVMTPETIPPDVLAAFRTVEPTYNRSAASGTPGTKTPVPVPTNPAALEADIKSLRQEIKRDPSNPQNYFLLSDRLHDQKKLGDARDVLQDLVKRDPKNGKAFLELGALDVEARQSRDAVEHLARAAQLLPTDVEVWYNLGLAYLDLKDAPHARDAFAAGLGINPDFKDLRDRAARLEAAAQAERDRTMAMYDKAMGETNPHNRISILRDAQKILPKEPRILIALGNAYADVNEFEDAAKTIEKCIEVQPEKGDLYLRASDLWVKNGDFQKALSVLQKAHRLKSEILEVQYETGKIYLQQKKYAEASREFQKILTADPRYKDTAQLYDNSVRLSPGHLPR